MTPDAAAVAVLVVVVLAIVGVAIVRARPEDIPAIVQALARLGRKWPAAGGQPELSNTWSNVCSTSLMAVTPDPLARRLPAGLLIDSTRLEPLSRQAEIWCADRSWRPVRVLAWARYRDGWAVLLGLPDGSEAWYLYESNVIRKAAG